VGAHYIQNNPGSGDGKQAFIDYFEAAARAYPGDRGTRRSYLGRDVLISPASDDRPRPGLPACEHTPLEPASRRC
jgi:hypothetical protein